ncbi:MAG: hypothetical protein P8N48_05160 [Bacteroidales bacterium]|jgi:hypothetical protein|nr:hypothetical protein [Bacteroidales bacterium]MDG1901837.1 hypothetical protein [Bacteroidales bacterium]MDG2081160.1 hypothetical protein [Bacteroidales bacterium]|tara:strand:- start:4797 stop:6101 length:1305 start_codon:yes stop_codon:yes gene_type:complete
MKTHLIKDHNNESINPRSGLMWLLFILVQSSAIFLVNLQPIYAQSIDDETIDINVSDVKLSMVLITISDQTNINFSYNSDEAIFSKPITYSAYEKNPLIILDEILIGTEYGFKMIGNQVVIFRKANQTKETQKKEDIKSEPTITVTKYIPKLIYDTIFITDTLIEIKRDTILITDSIFIEKQFKDTTQNVKNKEMSTDYSNQLPKRESGWAADIFIAPIISNFSLVRNDRQYTVRSYSLGAEISKIYGSWMIKGGMKLTNYDEKFNHMYSNQEGGFYSKDTIDEYYTVNMGDTAYYYVTDSTWKPISINDYNYNINNRIGLLEFTFSVTYDFIKNDKVRYYIRAGGQYGVLIYREGTAIPYPDQSEGVDFADLKFNQQSISLLGGIGLKYKFMEELDFNGEIYYFNYMDDIVKDYPRSTKINGLGLKLGLTYYF